MQNKDIKIYITNALVNFIKNTDEIDKYGQIGVLTPYQVFKDKKNEVIEYDKKNNLLSIRTYGGSLGTYQAFNISNITDPKLKTLCDEALKQNETRKAKLTTW